MYKIALIFNLLQEVFFFFDLFVLKYIKWLMVNTVQKSSIGAVIKNPEMVKFVSVHRIKIYVNMRLKNYLL